MTPALPRHLVVMRHGTAEAMADSDRDRALTPRGQREAAAAGEWLRARGFVPDHALVSSAVRTRATWTVMAEAAGWGVAPALESALYVAGPESALDLLRTVPTDVHALLVLGHNPTVGQLAQLLGDGAGDPDATVAMAHGFPPSSLALFEVLEPWERLTWGDARVTGFHAGTGG